MLDFTNQRALIVAPHPDDEIFGCGGLISRLKKAGSKVYVLFLTVGGTKDFSKKGFSTMDERIKEVEKVVDFMKIDDYRLVFPGDQYHLRLDHLPQRDLINEIERGDGVSMESVEPTIVATPMIHDYNQDHRAAAEAMVTAMRPKPSNMRHTPCLYLQYELPPSMWITTPWTTAMNFFVNMEEDDLSAKSKAMSLYASQIKDKYAPLSPYGIDTLAKMRGIQCGTMYAEAYVARRVLT